MADIWNWLVDFASLGWEVIITVIFWWLVASVIYILWMAIKER